MTFFELTSCRSFGQSYEGPIWWTAIDTFCERYGIYGENRDDVFFHLGELDKAYMKYRGAELKKELAKNKTGVGKNGLTKRNNDG